MIVLISMFLSCNLLSSLKRTKLTRLRTISLLLIEPVSHATLLGLKVFLLISKFAGKAKVVDNSWMIAYRNLFNLLNPMLLFSIYFSKMMMMIGCLYFSMWASFSLKGTEAISWTEASTSKLAYDHLVKFVVFKENDIFGHWFLSI